MFGARVRARLRNLFLIANGKVGEVSKEELRSDINFLKNLVADSSAHTTILMKEPSSPPVAVFTDADGKGGIGAVLIMESLTDAVSAFSSVPVDMRQRLQRRKTQITAFELLAPVAAVETWKERLTGRRVVFFIDNDAALHVLRKGCSRRRELNLIVFAIHSLFKKYKITAYFSRVPSAHNCSDPVSRGSDAPLGAREGHLRWPRIDF